MLVFFMATCCFLILLLPRDLSPPSSTTGTLKAERSRRLSVTTGVEIVKAPRLFEWTALRVPANETSLRRASSRLMVRVERFWTATVVAVVGVVVVGVVVFVVLVARGSRETGGAMVGQADGSLPLTAVLACGCGGIVAAKTLSPLVAAERSFSFESKRWRLVTSTSLVEAFMETV